MVYSLSMLVVFLTIITTIYLLFAFSMASFDPLVWGYLARSSFAIVVAGFGWYLAVIATTTR